MRSTSALVSGWDIPAMLAQGHRRARWPGAGMRPWPAGASIGTGRRACHTRRPDAPRSPAGGTRTRPASSARPWIATSRPLVTGRRRGVGGRGSARRPHVLGPVAGFAYGAVRGDAPDVVVLVGPSHYASFAGVARAVGSRRSSRRSAPLPIDERRSRASRSMRRSCAWTPRAHAREHSLEMQLPFLARVLPGCPHRADPDGRPGPPDRRRARRRAREVLAGRRPLVVASSDLSHFHDRDDGDGARPRRARPPRRVRSRRR